MGDPVRGLDPNQAARFELDRSGQPVSPKQENLLGNIANGALPTSLEATQTLADHTAKQLKGDAQSGRFWVTRKIMQVWQRIKPSGNHEPSPSSDAIIENKMTESQKFKKSVLEHKTQGKSDDPVRYQVSESLMLEPSGLRKPKGITHQEVSKAALEARVSDDVGTFDTGVGKMTPYRFGRDESGEITITPDKVSGTSLLLGAEVATEKNHLLNTYVVMLDGKPVIRSGVINTEEKADEFIALLDQLVQEKRKEDPEFQLRVVSQQLNSFEGGESKLVNAQHRWVGSYVNKQLQARGLGRAIHLNMPTNRWYHATKFAEKLGLGGVLGGFLKGERLSKEQNLDGLGTLVGWVKEDLKADFDKLLGNICQKTDSLSMCVKRYFESSSPEDASLKDNLGKSAVKCQDLAFKVEVSTQVIKNRKEDGASKAELKTKERELKTAKRELKEARRKQKKLLTTQLSFLDALANGILDKAKSSGFEVSKIEPILERVNMVRQLLASQLGVSGKVLDRGQEGLVAFRLFDQLGATTALNCKSGLDRTGLWHANILAMKQVVAQGHMTEPELNKMLMDWASRSNELNKKIMGQRKLGQTLIDAEMEPEERQIFEFRKCVLDNLIKMGLPITLASTGVMGIKWNSGSRFQANLLPLQFLPDSMDVIDDAGKTTTVQFVNYDPKTGAPTSITKEGRCLLDKFSSLRGS